MDFCCDLPNDSNQKQVKANEVYLPWIFGKKNQTNGNQYRKETVKQNF